MEPNAVPAEAQMEALRRRASLGASSASIGADFANSLSPENPIATEGSTPMMTNPPTPSGGAAGFPTDQAGQQLKQEKSESRTIVDNMLTRLKVLSKRGE